MEYEDGCLHACKDQGKEQPAQNYMYMYISIMRFHHNSIWSLGKISFSVLYKKPTM